MNEAPDASGDETSKAEESWLAPAITAITGVLAAATTTATALAALAGGGQRLLVNEPELTLVALVCFSAGLIVLFAALLARQHGGSGGLEPDARSRVFISAAGILIVVGTVILVALVFVVGSRPQQPNITASLERSVDGLVLTGTATSSELDLDSRLWVTVHVFRSLPWPAARRDATTRGELLLIAQAGPGGSERVVLPYSVELPSTGYEWLLAKAWEGEPSDLLGEPCIDFTVNTITNKAEILSSTASLSCVYQRLPAQGADSDVAASSSAEPVLTGA